MLTRSEVSILAASMMLDETVYNHVVNKTSQPFFDPAIYPAEDILIRLFTERVDDAGSFMNITTFGKFLVEDLEDEITDYVIADSVLNLYQSISEITIEDLDRNVVENITNKYINNTIMMTTEAKFKTMISRSESNVEEILQEALASAQNSNIKDNDTSCYHQPLLSPSKYMVKHKYWPTGVKFFDDSLGNGIRSNMMGCFLAPTGGGKTVLTLQLAMSWIKQSKNHHSVVMNYEQPPEGDINERLLSITTGMNISTFRGKKMEELDLETISRIEKGNKNIAPRFHLFDYSGDQGKGNEGPISVIKALEQIGQLLTKEDHEKLKEELPPTLVIIDWLIPFMNRFLNPQGKTAIGEELRGEGTKVMDTLKTMKNKYNIHILILHQSAAVLTGASSNRRPQLDDAQEWKGLPQFFEYCVGVGTRNEHNICIFGAAKNRMSDTGDTLLKMDGAYARFVSVENEYMISNSKIIPKVAEDLYEEEETPMALQQTNPTKDKIRSMI